MSTSLTEETKHGFTRSAYLRAKVLAALASQCHNQHLLFASLGQDEMAEAYAEAKAGLHDQARKLFPLYPHPHFAAGKKWARENGFNE
jgi:hypothetical protein